MSRASEVEQRLDAAHQFYCKILLYATSTSGVRNPYAYKSGVSEGAKIALITALYGASVGLLCERYFDVIDIYLSRRWWAKWFVILNIDRSDFAVATSANFIRDELLLIVRALLKDIDPSSNISVAIQKIICPPQWTSLEELAELLMEEISFLAKRVDDITNMMIGLVGQGLTLVVIGLTALGILYAVHSDACKDELEKERVTQSNGLLNKIDGDIKFEGQSIPTINDNIASLQFSMKSLNANIALIPDKIEALNMPLNDLKLELGTQKPMRVIINNNLPSSPTSKKQNGLINIETSQ